MGRPVASRCHADSIPVKRCAIVAIVAIARMSVGRIEGYGEYYFSHYYLQSTVTYLHYSLPDHHPCTKPCHAPSACPELEPCAAIVTLSCPCGRIKRQVPCGRSLDYPTGRNLAAQPKCTSECQIAQRNARLAEALGIDPSSPTRGEKTPATYSPELISFARANAGFLKVVETAFAE